MAVFRELRGVNVKFLLSNPEKCGTASFDVLRVKIGSGAWAVGRWKNPEKIEAESTSLMRNFAHAGKRNPLRDHD